MASTTKASEQHIPVHIGTYSGVFAVFEAGEGGKSS